MSRSTYTEEINFHDQLCEFSSLTLSLSLVRSLRFFVRITLAKRRDDFIVYYHQENCTNTHSFEF